MIKLTQLQFDKLTKSAERLNQALINVEKQREQLETIYSLILDHNNINPIDYPLPDVLEINDLILTLKKKE